MKIKVKNMRKPDSTDMTVRDYDTGRVTIVFAEAPETEYLVHTSDLKRVVKAL